MLKCCDRRRHGGAAGGRRALAESDRQPIIEGYGLSETSPVLTCNRGDIAEWTGTIGLPLPSTEIAIRDDDGQRLPLGEPGEICVRGPQVMPGYWNRPDETAQVMTRGRLLPHRRHRRDGRRRAAFKSSTARRT